MVYKHMDFWSMHTFLDYRSMTNVSAAPTHLILEGNI